MMDKRRASDDERGLSRAVAARCYETGRDAMFRLAWLVLGDAYSAEEIVQEAYTRLWEHPERVLAPDRVDAYVRSIVLNLARSRHTTRVRRGRLSLRVVNDPTGAGRTADHDPMAGVDNREFMSNALDALSPNQRICVVCRYWLGLTDNEVAEATGFAVGTVKTHLRRALTTLRKTLSDTEVATLEANHAR